MASPFNESHFPSAVSPELLSCCPAVDLSATVSEDDDAVYIRRQNGELVFRHSERNLKVQAVRWKPDGIYLPKHARCPAALPGLAI